MRYCILYCLLAMWTALFFLSVSPERDPKKPKAPDRYQYPDINAKSTIWGRVEIDRDSGYFTIKGHSHWTAEGQVYPKASAAKGRAYLMWTQTRDGRLAPGVYEIDAGGTLVGQWGYDDECTVDVETCTIKGNVRKDIVAKSP